MQVRINCGVYFVTSMDQKLTKNWDEEALAFCKSLPVAKEIRTFADIEQFMDHLMEVTDQVFVIRHSKPEKTSKLQKKLQKGMFYHNVVYKCKYQNRNKASKSTGKRENVR